MPNREGGYGGYQSSQPQQNRMPRKVNAPGSGKVDIAIFKWAKAGWKGSNVVKTSHITAGLKRFTACLRQVMESPRLPSSDAIAAKHAGLKAMATRNCARSFPALAPISPNRTTTRWTKRLSVPCSTTAHTPARSSATTP